VLSDNSKRVNQLNVRGPNGSDVEVGATRNHDAVSTPKQSVLIDNEKVSDRGTTQSLPSSGGAQNETLAGSPHPNSLSHQGNSANMLVVNASAGENTEMKELKQSRKVNDPNGIDHHHHSSSRNASSNGHRVRDLDGPSSVKRDSSSQAANNALKEAKNMKHMADRVKVFTVYLLRICLLFDMQPFPMLTTFCRMPGQILRVQGFTSRQL
jgi:hypothetical protein